MGEELTREQAAADLGRAGMAAGRVRGRARWMSVYFAVFGVFFGAETLLLGLVQPLAVRMTVFAVSAPVVIIAMILWAWHRGAIPRSRLPGVWAWAGSGALYVAVLVAGTPRLEGRVWYWGPAAVVVALPLCVAGWRERRR